MSLPVISARWEHFSHQADMGVRGIGPTMATAFEQAALAVIAVITDPGIVHADAAVPIVCLATDAELLLVDWLNAIVYEMATRKMLFGRFDVRIDDTGLRATVYGEPVNQLRHAPVVEVKGATYTALAVRQDPDGTWVAQCVVDV